MSRARPPSVTLLLLLLLNPTPLPACPQNVTKFMIEDTVRFLVLESLERYVVFMEGCCSAKVTIEAPKIVTADFYHKVPLLTLELQVVDDARVGYVQAPDLFRSKTLAAFDTVLQRLAVSAPARLSVLLADRFYSH